MERDLARARLIGRLLRDAWHARTVTERYVIGVLFALVLMSFMLEADDGR